MRWPRWDWAKELRDQRSQINKNPYNPSWPPTCDLWLSGTHMIRSLCIVLATSALLGCSGGGRRALRSAEHRGQALGGSFNQGVYGFDNANSLHVLLIEGDVNNPKQEIGRASCRERV